MDLSCIYPVSGWDNFGTFSERGKILKFEDGIRNIREAMSDGGGGI